jgi:hypothetical protein
MAPAAATAEYVITLSLQTLKLRQKARQAMVRAVHEAVFAKPVL